MARSKTDVTKNIRKKIVGSSSIDYSGEVGQNLQLSKTLHGVSSYIETLTTNQQDLFKKLIAAVQEIPKNNAELQKQQKNVFDNLIKTTALLKKAAENEKDPEKKKELEAAAASMMERGSSIQKNTDDSPRGIREMIGAKRYGINPLEIREKGLVRSVFSQAKRDIVGGSYEPKFETMVEKQQDALSLPETLTTEPQKNKDKNLKEKTRDNLRGAKELENIMKSLLTEVSVIRKVVEGRMKFDPKTKGYKDPDTGQTLGKADARRAGEGLFTKEEIGKQLELSDAEIKKTKLADLEKQLESKEEAVDGKVDGKKAPEYDFYRGPSNAERAADRARNLADDPRSVEDVARGIPQKEGSLDAAETQFLKKQGFDDAMITKIAASKAKASNTSAPASTTPANASIEANPNTLRDVSKIDQNPFDEARFASSGIDKDTEKTPVQGSTEKSGGGLVGGGILSSLFDGAKNRLFKKTAEKVGTKTAVKVAEKAAVKAGTKAAGKAAAKKAVVKAGSKALGKSLLKKIPVIGLIAGIGFGVQRAMSGDFKGAALEVASGAASMVPGAGTAASIALDAGLAVRDVKTAMDTAEVAGDTEAAAGGTEAASAMGDIPGQLAPAVAQVEGKKRQNIASVENSAMTQAGKQQSAAMPPVVNNVVTNNAAPATSGGKDTSYAPPVRTNDNSFLRYQDRRMTRVL